MNKLKLGKKKILGFVTAGAIVVTMAGSYAVWDTLNTDVSATLTLDKPVTTTLVMDDFASGARTLGEINTYTSDATYSVTNVPDGTDVKAAITPEILNGETDITSDFDITIKKGDNTLPVTSGSTVVTDENVDKANINTYSVTIKPKEDSGTGEASTTVMDIAKKDDSSVTVKLTTQLSTK